MSNQLLHTLSHGFYRVIKRCVQALPSRLIRFRPFAVYEILLSESAARTGKIEPPKNRQVRWISEAKELELLVDLADPKNLSLWNGSSRQAAVVWQDDRPVGVVWAARERFSEQELGLRFQLAQDEIWLYAAVVLPALRQQGVYRLLLDYLVSDLSEAGIRRILFGISAGNKPSLRAHQRQGAKRIGAVFAVRSCGWGICRVGGAVRKVTKERLLRQRDFELAVAD